MGDQLVQGPVIVGPMRSADDDRNDQWLRQVALDHAVKIGLMGAADRHAIIEDATLFYNFMRGAFEPAIPTPPVPNE